MPDANVVIRDFEPRDYDRIAKIFHANYPEYDRSIDELQYDDENFDHSKYVLKRYVATTPTGEEVAAVAEYAHTPWMFHPQKFRFSIDVDPEWQGQGVGAKLYARITDELKALRAIALRGFAREDMPRSISFLLNRGFSEKMRAWESRLRVQEFDFGRFAGYAERVEAKGIRIVTLAEEMKNEECIQKLYRLNMDLMKDVPMPDKPTEVSFEHFLNSDFRHPDCIPEAYFIAKDRERYVGLSNARRSQKEPRDLYQALTGVRREHRGWGIAMALKLKVIDYARHHRYEVIKTWNESRNANILAINQKLGFTRRVGWITFEKELSA